MKYLLRLTNLILATIIISLPLFMPVSVYAATETLTLSGEGAEIEGTYTGGAGTFANLNSDDGDTSYLSWGTGTHYHCFEASNMVATPASITSVQVVIKGRDIDTSRSHQITPYIRISGTNYLGSGSTFPSDGSYGLVSHTWLINPLTGNVWTKTEVDAVQYGIKHYKYYSGSDFVSYMYIVITYSAVTTATVDTTAASGIGSDGTTNFTTLNGDITDDGGGTITAKGFAWSTTSNTTTPNSTQVPPATYTSNTTSYGSYLEGVFSANVTTFLACTTYYYRAYAYTASGWAWGDEVSFKTLCPPTITTQAAIYVSNTSARLKATITLDGGQSADVRFSYGTATGNCTAGSGCTTSTCNATSYTTSTAWVENTYTTGQEPYVDITGLTAGTTYYFCAQIRNDYSCSCGGELTLTTGSSIGEPTSFKGIPTATTISLVWVKGTGSNKTLIRYKFGSYPNSTADGTLVYLDTETSVKHTGLTPGTTYYYRAWGESGGAYSTANATLMVTTVAAASDYDDQPVPTTPSTWFQAPDYTKMSAIPFYGIVNWWADTYQMDRSTLWFGLWLLFCIALGILIYWKSGGKVIVGIVVVLIFMGLGASMGLMSLWLLLPTAIIMFGAIALGERI